MVTGIHHYSMKCNSQEELDKVKDFYLRLLGFKLKREWNGGIMIDAGNALIEVFCNGEGIKDKGAIRHIAFAADDVDEIVDAVKKAGYEVFIEPNDILIPSNPECRARMAFCYGPLGEQVEFFCEK